jgi:hypothetical protein
LKYFLPFARTSRAVGTTHTSGTIAVVGCGGVKVGVVAFGGGIETVYIARAVRRIGEAVGRIAVQHSEYLFLFVCVSLLFCLNYIRK